MVYANELFRDLDVAAAIHEMFVLFEKPELLGQSSQNGFDALAGLILSGETFIYVCAKTPTMESLAIPGSCASPGEGRR